MTAGLPSQAMKACRAVSAGPCPVALEAATTIANAMTTQLLDNANQQAL